MRKQGRAKRSVRARTGLGRRALARRPKQHQRQAGSPKRAIRLRRRRKGRAALRLRKGRTASHLRRRKARQGKRQLGRRGSLAGAGRRSQRNQATSVSPAADHGQEYDQAYNEGFNSGYAEGYDEGKRIVLEMK